MNRLVLLSGGMDSTTLAYYVTALQKQGETTKAISFHYGSKHNDRELSYAAKTIKALKIEHDIIHLEAIAKHFKSDLLKTGGDIPEGHYADESMKRTVVPFRNGIMLSYAAGYAESHNLGELYIANHAGDHHIYPDCRLSFVEAMNKATREGTYNGVKIVTPFVGVDKSHIAGLGDRLGVQWVNTYSCYNGRERHCGKCGTCVERKEAFSEAGVNDPSQYDEI